jgi:oligopeptide/dipeptide ABC transporter ATP-binding protein
MSNVIAPEKRAQSMNPLTDKTTPVLQARNVTKEYATSGSALRRGRIAAVDQVSLSLYEQPAKIISLVGESGSGKTTFSRILLGLTPPSHGEVLYHGKNIFALNKEEFREYRTNVQSVVQDPYGIYNPFYRIERVLELVIRNFKLAKSKSHERELMEEALRAVDLRPNDIIGRYPHQLSGGERQRVMLARLFLLKPKIIIADEPVSMIDVAVRTLFLNILIDFRDTYGISCLFITHNLSTAHYLGGKIMVLCFGRVVESGDIDQVLKNPSHPYTQQLLASVPSNDPEARWTTKMSLESVERPLTHQHNKCVYVARCPFAMPICSQQHPPDFAVRDDQHASCFLYDHQEQPAGQK